MMELSDVGKRYGDVVALERVSFTAANGMVTGVLGPNGAGKTTALRALMGLIRPTTGSARVDDIDVQNQALAARARLGVLPESAGLYDRLTVREHLHFASELHGVERIERACRVEQMLEQLSLEAIADRPTGELSLGLRRRVLLGAALVHDPPNVVLDEPTNGLDVVSAREVRKAIRRLATAGRAIILSSHVIPEVAAVCDSIVILSKGHVVAVGTPREIQTRANASSLEEAFVQLIGSAEGLN
jgi:sodium transport system ATP-binding protein